MLAVKTSEELKQQDKVFQEAYDNLLNQNLRTMLENYGMQLPKSVMTGAQKRDKFGNIKTHSKLVDYNLNDSSAPEYQPSLGLGGGSHFTPVLPSRQQNRELAKYAPLYSQQYGGGDGGLSGNVNTQLQSLYFNPQRALNIQRNIQQRRIEGQALQQSGGRSLVSNMAMGSAVI
ncbi:hypothetical protein KDA23_05615 [Candidatus Saccharibacteria bacterium]|nr:hypothetical protein [Candidatus Saccharibacteria bacterium]